MQVFSVDHSFSSVGCLLRTSLFGLYYGQSSSGHPIVNKKATKVTGILLTSAEPVKR